jgi:7,8-dihydroneopterin aldolase/epimerase/oxygenase
LWVRRRYLWVRGRYLWVRGRAWDGVRGRGGGSLGPRRGLVWAGGGPGSRCADVSLDRICLLGLRAIGRHGVFDFERIDGQEFVIDAVLWVDTRAAAAADDLSRTVDYGAVADRLAQIVAGEPVALIETLAERLAAACLDDDRVHRVEITVHKPQAPVAQRLSDIAVVISRDRA